MIRSIKAMLNRGKERYRVPRCVRDVIPVKAIWKDGISRVGNKYSKTFSFTDINYQAAGKKDVEEAREYFNRVGSELKTYLAALGWHLLR